MPVLRNSRHEKCALIVAKGKTRSEAYREVTGSAKNADANADNWLNAPGVRERIAELQEQTAEECGMEHRLRKVIGDHVSMRHRPVQWTTRFATSSIPSPVRARCSPRRFRLEANWPSFATGVRRPPNSRRATAFFRSLTRCSGVEIQQYDPRDIEAFQDPIWRISNLYSIRIRDGSVIPFRPRPQQLAVLEMLFVRGYKRIIILKARQIGFSTLLGVVCCDQLCFNPGQQISLIDQTLEDARQKLKNIVVLAYDSMAAS